MIVGKLTTTPWQVHVLASPSLALFSKSDFHSPLGDVALEHGEGNRTVGAENLRARLNVLGQIRVGHGNLFRASLNSNGGQDDFACQPGITGPPHASIPVRISGPLVSSKTPH